MRQGIKLAVVFAPAVVLALAYPGAVRAEPRGAVFPLFIEDQYTQDIDVRVDQGLHPEQRLEIEEAPLLEQLRTRVEKPIEASLRSRGHVSPGDPRRFIRLSAINSAGLIARFDEKTLEIRLYLPAAMRAMNIVSIGHPNLPAGAEVALEPSAVSGYLNLNGGQDFSYGGTGTGREPLRGEFDGAFNVQSFVLEGSGGYTEATSAGTPEAWRRGDFRVVKDWTEKVTRFSLGDLSYPVSGFQRFRPMAGVSASSNFALQPYRTFAPVSSQDITLKSRSTIRILINGRLIQTLELPAGRHSLRDLPFSTGVNDVLLEIMDDVGRVEVVRIPYFTADFQLSRDTHQLTYSLGIPSMYTGDAGASRVYDGTKPTTHLSHRYGFSERFTAGGFLQADPNQRVLGLTALLATGLGSFSVEPAISSLDGTGQATGLHLGYQYIDYRGLGATQRSLALNLEARAPKFAALGETPDPTTTAYDVSTGYGQEIFWQTSANVSGALRLGAARSRTISAGLARAWRTGLDTSLLYTNTQDPGLDAKSSVLFFLTWTFPESGHSLSFTSGSENGLNRLQWGYASRASNQVGGVTAQAAVERTDSGKSADGRFEYVGNRGRASLVHQSLSPDGTPGVNRTGVRAGSALVFAGGQFGISRNVFDSFALIQGVKNLESQELKINPRQDGADERYEAASGWLGPASSPEVVSYRYTQLHVGAEDLPVGTGPIAENHLLLPSYKSGTLIRLGTEARVVASGRLVDSRGRPVALWSGEAPGPSGPVFVFTNRTGHFSIEGLRAGPFRARSYDNPRESLEFTLPASSSGQVELGSVILVRK